MKFLQHFLYIFIFFAASAATGIIIGYNVFSLPDFNEVSILETYRPPVITKIYSADKTLISELYFEKRQNHHINHFSPFLIKALIATEDRSFYEHSGISPKGILRAVVTDIKAMSFAQGASTITQQLAKTLFLSSEKKIKRKLNEILIAFQIERKYTKKEILALYLNQIYLGSGAYGAEAASKTYFGKSASELNLQEAALIAGMPKAPSLLSPFNNYELAGKRRNQVLANMNTTRQISQEEYKKAVKSSIELNTRKKQRQSYSWYVNFIRQKLEREIGYDLLYKSGLKIFTSLDTRIQENAEISVKKNLAILEKRMKNKKIKSKPECAVVVLDIKTGAVLAMVGGKDFSKSKFNRVTIAKRQPGSSFKPFIYALAIKDGYSQNCTLRDVPTIFNISPKKEWKPQNFSRTYSGEMTIRKALAKSKNIPAVRMLEKLKPQRLADFAKTLGINSQIAPTLSMALGTYETTLLELTNAYTVFPRKGIYKAPWYVEKIQSGKENIYPQKAPKTKRVFPERESAVVVDLLTGVMEEGTGKRGRINGYPLAGKTGTTDDYRDALFIGFSPSIAIGVWVGCDDNTSLGRYETGAKAALPIWYDIMKEIVEHKKYPEYFPVPDKVILKTFDPDSGKILDRKSLNGTTGLFLQENQNGC